MGADRVNRVPGLWTDTSIDPLCIDQRCRVEYLCIDRN